VRWPGSRVQCAQFAAGRGQHTTREPASRAKAIRPPDR
jgi:hypothetical protein